MKINAQWRFLPVALMVPRRKITILMEADRYGFYWRSFFSLTITNRWSKNSTFTFKFCVSPCNAIWKSYAKNEENPFFEFFTNCKFSYISIFNSKFCVGLCSAIEISYAKKWRKSIHKIPIYAIFSHRCAPKPVGRIDPSRFEMVKACCLTHLLSLEVRSPC